MGPKPAFFRESGFLAIAGATAGVVYAQACAQKPAFSEENGFLTATPDACQ
jgi:hypothetical protein